MIQTRKNHIYMIIMKDMETKINFNQLKITKLLFCRHINRIIFVLKFYF